MNKRDWRKIAPHLYKTLNGYFVDLQPGFKSPRYRQSFIQKADADKFILDKKIEWQQEKLLGVNHVQRRIRVSEFFDRFYAARGSRQKHADRTVRPSFDVLKKYFGDLLLTKLRLEDIDRFIQHQREQGLEVGTTNRYLVRLKAALKWGVQNEYLAYDIAARIKKLKGDNKRERWLTEEEVNRLLIAAKQLNDPDLVDFITVAVYTGFRKSNLEQLEAAHISDSFTRALKTKSDKPYQVPHLDNRIRGVYERLVRVRPTGPLLNTSNLKKRFRRATLHAGLYTNAKDLNRVTIHVLRHTFASWCLQAGVPIYTVSKWLGHSSVKMTEDIYGHLSKDHHIEAAQRVSMPVLSIDTLSTQGVLETGQIFKKSVERHVNWTVSSAEEHRPYKDDQP